MALGSPPDDPVRGLAPCFIPPRLLQSGGSFCRILPVASDAPVRGTGFTPGRSSPGANVVLHSAPVAPIQGRLFVVFSLLPRTLQSVVPGSPPDDPVRGLAPCFIPPRLLQSGGSFCHILSAASDAPVRGTGLTPGRSSPGANVVLHSAPVAPIQGGLFVIFSPLPPTLQSVAPGSPPDDPVRGLAPFLNPPWLLQSGGSFCRTLSAASDAPVRGAGFTPGRSSPGANVVLHSAPVAPIRGVFLSYSPRCFGRSSPWHRVHTGRSSPGAPAVLPLAPDAPIRGVMFLSLLASLRLLSTGVRARCVVWCVRCGCRCVLACAIPLQRRCGLFVFCLFTHFSLHIASYGVLLILPVLDSLILATPKSKRV